MSLSVTSLVTLLKQLVRCASTSSLHHIELACLIHIVIVTIILKFELCGKNQDIHLMREAVRKRIILTFTQFLRWIPLLIQIWDQCGLTTKEW